MIIVTILVSIIASILAGMGVGGGTLFIVFATMFLNLHQKDAQALNLVMFISVGISATLSNFKSNAIDKNLSKRIIPLLLIGMFVGSYFVQKINNNDLKKYFLAFMLLTGVYEIISSLISIKKAKDNSK